MALSNSQLTLPRAWCRRHLTAAEQRVVALIGAGIPTKVAAAQLGRSPLTVRNQLNRAMHKLGVTNRYELMARLRPVPTVPATPADTNTDFFANAI